MIVDQSEFKTRTRLKEEAENDQSYPKKLFLAFLSCYVGSWGLKGLRTDQALVNNSVSAFFGATIYVCE